MSAFPFLVGLAWRRRLSLLAMLSLLPTLPLLAACDGRERSTREHGALGASGRAGSEAIDDYGAVIAAGVPARRIVSLNPTTTELLFALGAGDRLVARSRWDQWPVEARAISEVGDAIRPSVERIIAARPDLVLLYASGDNRDAASSLGAAGIRVVALRIDRIADFERGVRIVGALAGHDAAATEALDSLHRSLDVVREALRAAPRLRVFLHAWDNPLMAIGGGSYLSELVEIAGGRNVYRDLAEPSPQVSFEDLVRRDPDVILAGPGEAARLVADPRWRALRAVRDGRVLAYDTMLVARPSLRLGEGARALAALLHPAVVIP